MFWDGLLGYLCGKWKEKKGLLERNGRGSPFYISEEVGVKNLITSFIFDSLPHSIPEKNDPFH